MNKRDEESDVSIFSHVNKEAVLQSAQCFNDLSIDIKKCQMIFTQILYLLLSGESFSNKEATTLFFQVIKLFHSNNLLLRRMMYLVIKELSSTAQDVIMVTQSLIKDIQSNQEANNRANAVRTLCSITEPSMIGAIERIVKACIVDKNPLVSVAALVSSYHLFDYSKDTVCRWAPEVQEAIQVRASSQTGSSYFSFYAQSQTTDSDIAQYHALALLYRIRQHDRVAVVKLFHVNNGLKNPMAICFLIRCASKIMEDDPRSIRPIYEQLVGYLNHRSEMVNLEAARAICNLKDSIYKEIRPALTVLQKLLNSSSPVHQLASLRVLNSLASRKPTAIGLCSNELESLASNLNHSIAVMAFTALLRTGDEAIIDRILKETPMFMSKISNELKTIIIDTIHSLCQKIPKKQFVILNFLNRLLRDEGGYDYKKSIVQVMLDIVSFSSKDLVLSYLCEFVEDCEFPELTVCIIHLLGVEGPKTSTPEKYIRYIYNRFGLENSVARVAAVNALAKFGLAPLDEKIKDIVMVLLKRCQDDTEDEVRDRATLALELMKKGQGLESPCVSLSVLESELVQYTLESNEKTFGLNMVSELCPKREKMIPSPPKMVSRQSSWSEKQSLHSKILSCIPEIAVFGALFNSSQRFEITERETEYVVGYVKHMFAKHIVFQFDCLNTMNDQLLENIEMVMDIDHIDSGLVKVFALPATKLEFNVLGYIYIAYEKQDIDDFPLASFASKLKFIAKGCNQNTEERDEEGFEDEYQVEDTEISVKDYIRPAYVSDFEQEFENFIAGEAVDFLSLGFSKAPNLQVACTLIIDTFGLQPLQDSSLPRDPKTHTLIMSGTFLTGEKILARCLMTFDHTSGITFNVSVRSENKAVSQFVLSAIV